MGSLKSTSTMNGPRFFYFYYLTFFFFEAHAEKKTYIVGIRNSTTDSNNRGGDYTYSTYGCKCNGKTDSKGRGGTCTAGSPVGNWCYVKKDMCQDQEKYKGKYYSVKACSKPCVCNGETDEIGLGGSCGDYCYVDHDSGCTDRILSPYNGKRISKEVCKGKAPTKEINEDVLKENAEMKEKIRSLEIAFEKMNSNIKSNIEVNIATITSSIAKNTNDISTMNKNIKTNSNNIKTHTSNIRTNTDRIKSYDTRITTNINNIATCNKKISTNSANIATNSKYVAICVTAKTVKNTGRIKFSVISYGHSSDGSDFNYQGEYVAKTTGMYEFTYSAQAYGDMALHLVVNGEAWKKIGAFISGGSEHKDQGSRTVVATLRKGQKASLKMDWMKDDYGIYLGELVFCVVLIKPL